MHEMGIAEGILTSSCPSCGGWVVMLLRGRELKIDSIDIDEEDDA
jgi:Zn finger protein HypA/HybF involved in hydrogenase expression